MGMSKSLLMYEDVRELFDRAMAKDIGISIHFETPGEAVHFRQRAYTFRNLHRGISSAAFDEGDPRNATSLYDILEIRWRNKGSIVEIRRRDAITLTIRELKE